MNGRSIAICAVLSWSAACGEPKGRDTAVHAPPVAAARGTAVQQAPTGAVSTAAPPTAAAPPNAAAPLAAGLPAGAAPAGRELDAKLRTAFGGFEHVPDREELLSLAPEAELGPALWSLWQDPAARLSVRTNALVSLRFFPSPQVQARFEQLLQDPATSAVVRRPLAKAYGYAFGAAALPLLSQLLDHAELHTRDSAARALAAINDAKVRPLLEKRLAAETEPSVRQTLQRLLAAPAGRP